MNLIINDKDIFVTESMKEMFSGVVDEFFITGRLYDVLDIIRVKSDIILITELVTLHDSVFDSLHFLQRCQFYNPNVKIFIFTEIEDLSVLGLVQLLLPEITILTKTDSVVRICQVINEASVRPYSPLSKKSMRNPRCLTMHELKTMKWLGSGMSLKNIAEKVKRSPKTVSAYRRSAFTKLGCKSEAAFVSKLRKLGLTGGNV